MKTNRATKVIEQQEEQDGEDWVIDLIREVQEEQRTNPMTEEEVRKEEEELARYGEAQSRKLGITEKDIPRLIREYRARHRS